MIKVAETQHVKIALPVYERAVRQFRLAVIISLGGSLVLGCTGSSVSTFSAAQFLTPGSRIFLASSMSCSVEARISLQSGGVGEANVVLTTSASGRVTTDLPQSVLLRVSGDRLTVSFTTSDLIKQQTVTGVYSAGPPARIAGDGFKCYSLSGSYVSLPWMLE